MAGTPLVPCYSFNETQHHRQLTYTYISTRFPGLHRLRAHHQLLFGRHLQLQRSVRLLVESLAIVTERQRSKLMRERATN